jgi:glycosyltransferase involved in cell wall biosynthesis
MAPRRIGILSREFFDAELGRMGGFGFATRRAAEALREAGHQVVLVAGTGPGPSGALEADSGGFRVLFGSGRRWADLRRWRRLDLDVLLTVDWHSSFLPVTRALPRTPVLLWSRDPRDQVVWDTIATLRTPSGVVADDVAAGSSPLPLEPSGSASDAGPAVLARRSARWRRPVRYLLTDECLVRPFVGRFGFECEWRVLGTPVDPVGATPADLPAPLRAGRPFIASLGRLDPIKRPWVLERLAVEVPELDVVVLGRQHIERGWSPAPAPNLHWLGHVDGPAKQAVLAGAVATVNTSIHETMALSLLESLHHGTPLVACVDPGGMVSRFGMAVAPVPGDGLAAVPHLADAVRSLAGDRDRRAALGAAGQDWARARHSRTAFLGAMGDLLGDVLGRARP